VVTPGSWLPSEATVGSAAPERIEDTVSLSELSHLDDEARDRGGAGQIRMVSAAAAMLEIGGGEFTFCAAHAEVHPYGLEPLHGHTYVTVLRLSGQPSGQPDRLARAPQIPRRGGMANDLGPIKAALRASIAPLRRRTLVPTRSPDLPVAVGNGRVRFGPDDQYYDLPAGAVQLLPIDTTTTEALAAYLLAQTTADLDLSNLDWVELSLCEAPGVTAIVRQEFPAAGSLR
jgi:6-pyruvoyl-tetrahydropterin synthase